MKFGKNLKAVSLGGSLLLLSGCGMFGGGEQESVPFEDTADQAGVGVGKYQSGSTSQVDALPGGTDRYGSGTSATELQTLLNSSTVYFDFDDTSLRAESRSLLISHANYLHRNNHKTVLLAGHADERGTREYNMALGEKRAITVRNFLLANGVAAEQLDTVSYGEEKPLDRGSNEQAWSQNRRVELKYQ